MRFDLPDLRLFLAIVDSGSITHGARKANLSLGAASGRVKQMEDDLGTPLLERHRHGVTPTAAGDCLLANARILVQQADKMRLDLIPFSNGTSGSLSILTNTAALHEHLPKRLALFLADYPGIEIETREMRSTDIGPALAAGRGQIGIAADADLPEDLERHFFADDQLVVVAPRASGFADTAEIGLSDLTSQTFIGLARGTALQQLITSQAKNLGMTLSVRVRVSGFHAMAQMIEAGAGIGIMPETSAVRCAHPSQLVWTALSDEWANRRLMLCVAPDAKMSKMSRTLARHLCGIDQSRQLV